MEFLPASPYVLGAESANAHGLNHCVAVWTGPVGATHVGFAATCPLLNGSPTRFGRFTPLWPGELESPVLALSVEIIGVNGCPLSAVAIPWNSVFLVQRLPCGKVTIYATTK